jgi:hypothetical protein
MASPSLLLTSRTWKLGVLLLVWVLGLCWVMLVVVLLPMLMLRVSPRWVLVALLQPQTWI